VPYIERVNARAILSANIRKLMDLTPALDTQVKIAGATRGRVSQKTVSNVLNGAGPQPTLETLDALATAFRVPAWTLLHPSLGLPVSNASEEAFHKKLEDALTAIKALRRP
jgi:transcriptional regulator with XRE-family HTH domain